MDPEQRMAGGEFLLAAGLLLPGSMRLFSLMKRHS